MRMVALCILSCLAFALAGCLGLGTTQQGAAEAEPEAQPEVPVVVCQPEPGLTAKARWKKAIDLLEVGEACQARAELVAYLGEKPTSSRAHDLLKQIDSDPVAYLGEKHFPYRMESGESLSIVAKRMLGDALKFHILARYNDIENPRKIVAGQVIRVPGDKPPPRVAEAAPEPAQPETDLTVVPVSDESGAGAGKETAAVETAFDTGTVETGTAGIGAAETVLEGQSTAADQVPSPDESSSGGVVAAPDPAQDADPDTDGVATAPPDESTEQPVETAALTDGDLESQTAPLEQLMQQAVAKVQEGDYAGAGTTYEEAIDLYPDDDFIKQMAALNYLTYAGTLETGGDREKAGLVLIRAQQLDPENEEIQQRLGHYARLDEADALYQEGTGHQAKGDLIAAYGSFQEAVSIVPNHNLANKKLLSLTPAVSVAYYRKGLTAYRRQDLDEAISMFDQCLQVDPDSKSCSVKRIEAVDLKKKYENLPPPE